MERQRGGLRLVGALLLAVSTLVAPVSAQAAAPPKTLRLDKVSLGGGVAAISTSPSGLSCGTDCTSASAPFAPKTKVTITASPGTGSSVRSWSSNCAPVSGNPNACTITMSADAVVTITLEKTQTLTVTATTTDAAGEVSGGGISCGSTGATCQTTVAYGTSVTLTATPTGGNSMLVGWSGNCSGSGTCTVAMTSSRSVGATFGPLAYPLEVTIEENGATDGKVTSDVGGIDCSTGTCSAMLAPETLVTLSASVTPQGARFVGWTGGPCDGSSSLTCEMTMSAARATTARFSAMWQLSASAEDGAFDGSVDCSVGETSVACSGSFDEGTQVAITATPNADAQFASWTGCDSTTSTCDVMLTADAVVIAAFEQKTFPFAVVITKAAGVAGSVSVNGVACSSGTCTSDVAQGATVTLVASATDGTSRFTGWTDCPSPDAATCTFTMDEAETVTASFVAVWDLTTSVIATDGFGGTVACRVGGEIVDCAGPFDDGTQVVVTATPGEGAMFVGWSGNCSGTGGCTVTMTVDRSVTATFREYAYAVTITKTSLGGGTGIVTLSAGPLTCGPACSSLTAYVAPGTALTVTAEPSVGSSFTGWGGACLGQGTTLTCPLTAEGPLTIGATFEAPQLLTVAKAGTGTGTVTGPNIDCGLDCSEYFPYGTSNVVLTATPTAANGSRVTGWSIKTCGTATTCAVSSLTAARTVTVTFALPTVSLTVQKLAVDSGTGAVSSSPSGISCSSSCRSATASFALNGGAVTLTAAPTSTTSYFVRWEGDCTPDPLNAQKCLVDPTSRLGDPLTVTAVFGKPVLRLTKTYLTGGTGSVTSSPKGISCSTTCTSASATYPPTTWVTLTATPTAGTTFGGWSGACTGTGTCRILMDRAQDVTAVFSKLLTLTVSVGVGGSVASVPAGTIDCTAGATCTASLTYGTSVTLVASPDPDYVFLGWTGSCAYSSTLECTVSMTDVRNVGASFYYQPLSGL